MKKNQPREVIDRVTLPEGITYEDGVLQNLNLHRIRSLQGKLSRALQGPGGARRVAENKRCPCGRFTKWLAVKRGHKCVGTPAA
jgi:hypothetical protein